MFLDHKRAKSARSVINDDEVGQVGVRVW